MTPQPCPVAVLGNERGHGSNRKACLALGLSLLFAAPAFAQTRPANRPRVRPPLLVNRLSTTGDYAIYGHGNALCGAWSASQPGTTSRDLFLAWVQGFLTGTGVFNEEQRKTTTEDLLASMTRYCQANPMDTIEVAASTLFASPSEQESPTLFIPPTEDHLEAFLAAAMMNKQVPVKVVTRPERATLMLTVSAVDIQQPSAGARLVRCLVAACGGLKDRGATSVQLEKGDAVLWSYTVNKGRAEKNRQAVAEAIAKQMKADYFRNDGTAGGVRATNASPDPIATVSPSGNR